MAAVAVLDDEQAKAAHRLEDDLSFFARNALRIRTKGAELAYLTLNRGQQHLHDRLEDQLKRTGKVRALVVKGRQIGASTYIGARHFHHVWKARGPLHAFILTHEQDATDNLFAMVQTFHDELPAGLKASTDAANAKELILADTKAGYRVSTAGSRETGRSSTYQRFHGSEVAFWPNAESHVAASLRTVGNLPGTEIILESTGNGVGNVFHRYALAATRGEGDFEVIFIPWFWSEDYQRPCPAEFEPSPEWLDYAKAHGLTWEQLYWAYRENATMATAISASHDAPCWMFRQEFPGTLEEAFQTSGDPFIPGALVLKARRPATDIAGHGPIILGVDPARLRDKVGIIDRCGRRMGERVCKRLDPGGSTDYVTAQVAEIIRRIAPDMVNIDTSEGTGAAVFEALGNLGYDQILTAVSFGARPIGRGPTGDRIYANRRAEMWDALREWLTNDDQPVQIPDDDGLQADLTAIQWGAAATRYGAVNNELILEAKDKVKERLGYSPDLGDAAALTFAAPFATFAKARNQPVHRRQGNRRTGY
jgi:hypothetical protein